MPAVSQRQKGIGRRSLGKGRHMRIVTPAGYGQRTATKLVPSAIDSSVRTVAQGEATENVRTDRWNCCFLQACNRSQFGQERKFGCEIAQDNALLNPVVLTTRFTSRGRVELVIMRHSCMSSASLGLFKACYNSMVLLMRLNNSSKRLSVSSPNFDSMASRSRKSTSAGRPWS